MGIKVLSDFPFCKSKRAWSNLSWCSQVSFGTSVKKRNEIFATSPGLESYKYESSNRSSNPRRGCTIYAGPRYGLGKPAPVPGPLTNVPLPVCATES